MAELFQVVTLMAIPAAIMLILRGLILRQNRMAAHQAVRIDHQRGTSSTT